MKIKSKINKMHKNSLKLFKDLKDNRDFLKTKKSKHIIISGSFLFLLLFFVTGYESSHFYNNYKAYEALNEIREEVDLSNYKENNYIVKNETLNNMAEDIETQLKNLHDDYVNNIENTNIDSDIDKLKDDDSTNDLEKYDKLKEVVQNDLEKQIDTKIEDINKIDIEEHDLTDSEESYYEEIQQSLKEVDDTKNNISDLYTDYESLTSLNDETLSLKKQIEKREAKEQKEAEEEAKRQAEEEAKAKEEEEAAATLDFTNLTSDLGVEGNFNRAIGDNMFTAINAYRSSLGLAPYTYNSGMQSCVDQEAQAYGTTQNPHNWVCPVANENASNAPVGSDAVSISMNFFMTDPPHEAVLSGNYSSVAVSAYESGGTDYIIVGVF